MSRLQAALFFYFLILAFDFSGILSCFPPRMVFDTAQSINLPKI